MNQPKAQPVTPGARLVIERQFSAPVGVVYAAWTEPERMKRWLHPGPSWINPNIEVDLRVGGWYRIEFHNTDECENECVSAAVVGVFQQIETNLRLVYTWTWEPPNEDAGVETLVTVEFIEEGSGALVRLTHERFASETMRQRHNQGWCGTLECLKSVLSIDNPSSPKEHDR